MAATIDRLECTVPASPPLAAELAKWLQLLKPGGVLKVTFPDASAADQGEKALLFAGFVAIARDNAPSASASGATTAGADPQVAVVARKPAWSIGASARLAPAKKAQIGQAAPTAPAKTTSKVLLSLGDDEDDLMDEDDLLDKDFKAPEAPEGGCITKPRACANCSCGRAEREADADAGTGLMDGEASNGDANAASACGNCYKGDAFRCAGCPHLGKPAFKPGQENLQLNLVDDI